MSVLDTLTVVSLVAPEALLSSACDDLPVAVADTNGIVSDESVDELLGRRRHIPDCANAAANSVDVMKQ